MLARSILYNLLMFAVDFAVLCFLRRKPTLSRWSKSVVCAGATAIILAVPLGGSPFTIFRMAAYGLFLHASLLLLGSAFLLWRRHRGLSLGMALSAVALIGVAVDAFLIEPTWLEVSRVTIKTSKVDRPVRIVVLADLQTDHIGTYERDVLRRVLREKPDVILLAGDYIQAPSDRHGELVDELNAFLREIDFGGQAKVFAVGGNTDRPDWPEIFADTSVVVAPDTARHEALPLVVTCLSEADSHDPRLQVESPDAERFHVVLGHRPDYALGQVEADLLIAGHTHGGQIRLPMIGPILKLSRVPRSWAAGRTELSDDRTLIVSRGIGMERHGAPRLRFLCRPELIVIDLVP